MNKIWICKFCGKELELKSRFTKSGHLATCQKWKEYKNKILTKEYIENEYIRKGKSAIEIAILHGLESAGSIIRLLKVYSLKYRTASEARTQKRCVEKIKNTCLEKYGSENPLSKDTEPYKKKMNTIKEKYGVSNVFQIQDIIDKINNDDYYIEKYGLTRRELISKRSKKVGKNVPKKKKQTGSKSQYGNLKVEILPK